MPQRSKWQSLPTEAINPTSVGLDKLSPVDLVDLMHAEDRKVLVAVQRERERLAVGIEMITNALRRGGRVVFVGAGTSGRLGILESAEMPPTFSTDPLLVQAVMAGGREAIFGAKEGVEDNYEEGARAMTRFHPTRADVVIGVSASGMTQFVRGALTRARKAGTRIIFVTCDPATELQTFVDLDHRPGGRRGGHRRLDAAQGRHGHQAGAEHADHRRHGPHRQDLRQPDGGRAHRFREAEGSGLPHRQHRHRARLRGVGAAAARRRTGT